MADLNPRMGTEPGKVRPVLVIQTDLLNEDHPSTIICPITTNVIREAEVLRVYLKRNRFGLKEDSDVMIDQMRSIDNRRLVKKLGALDAVMGAKVRENLKVVLDLD
jgi:mRNA interferase MazF